MSYSGEVAEFMNTLGPFYETVDESSLTLVEPEDTVSSVPESSQLVISDKDNQEDESGYSSSLNGASAEDNGIHLAFIIGIFIIAISMVFPLFILQR